MAVMNKISIDLFRSNVGSFIFSEITAFEEDLFASWGALEFVPVFVMRHLLFYSYFTFSFPPNIFIVASFVIPLVCFLTITISAFFQPIFDLFIFYSVPFAVSINHNTVHSSSFYHFDFSKSFVLNQNLNF